jgi:nickel/cobalt transporter (NicO) family protein
VYATLLLTAATVGALHSLAPDHWVPFAAVARARGWSSARTARVTLACGFGHVTVSVLMGLLGLLVGLEALEALGHRLEALAGVLLVAFGAAYALWGLRRAAGRRWHGHAHAHYDHVHDVSATSAWALFLLFSADPCVAVIPLMLAAASLGATHVAGLVAVYELATLAAMVGLVLPAHAGARVLRARWLDAYGDAAAGVLIAATGVVVSALGW